MNFHGTKLCDPRHPNLAQQRKERLKKVLDLDAPEVVIIMMAEGYLRSFRISWRGVWEWVKLNKFPNWLLWITDKDYRNICREGAEEFERDMRELLSQDEN
jgi:hypothetical protein